MLVSQRPLLAQDLSPRHGAGDHVIILGNNLLLTVSWEERKSRKEKQQLAKSSSHAKKEKEKKEIKGKCESEELVSFKNTVLQSNEALTSVAGVTAFYVCICCGTVWRKQT